VEIFPEVTTHPVSWGLRTPVRPYLSQWLLLGYSMIYFKKPSFDLVYDPFGGVYGLVMNLGYIWEYQPNSHDENL
jgi:hypothetical protein